MHRNKPYHKKNNCQPISFYNVNRKLNLKLRVIENGTIIIYEVFIRHGLTFKYYGNSSTRYSLVAIEIQRRMFYIVKTVWVQNISQTSFIL